MKKVFIVTGRGSLGGHNRSALISAREMIRRGYDVHTVTGGDLDIYKGYDIKLHKISTSKYMSYNFIKLKTILDFFSYANKHKPDIIHAFDNLGLMIGYIYSLFNNVKLVNTICGGPIANTFYYANMRPVIVFSEEQYDKYIENGFYNRDNLFISPGRLDLDFEVYSPEEISRYKDEVGLKPNHNIVLMISRIHSGKANSIRHFINVAQHGNNKDNLQFILVGMNQNEKLFFEISEEANKINKKFGYQRIIITEKESQEARKLLPIAKIAVGIGRTAYESMTKGIPTLVIGEYGFAGLAYGETCDELAKYNFSGRNAKTIEDNHKNEKVSYKVISKLKTDENYYQLVSVEGKNWGHKNMDIQTTGELYHTLYNRNSNFYIKPNIISVIKSTIYHYIRKCYYYIRQIQKVKYINYP